MANLICSNACRPAYLLPCKQTYRGNRLSMPAIQLKQQREQFIKLKFHNSAIASVAKEEKIDSKSNSESRETHTGKVLSGPSITLPPILWPLVARICQCA